MSDEPRYCGDCGALTKPVGEDGEVEQHFPDCITLREQEAGVEVKTTFSNQGRSCPRCKSEMTRNHDQQSDTWTWNCTGAMCGVTLDALPPIPGLEPSATAGFDEIARQPGAVVLEVDDDGTMRAPPGLISPSPDAVKELVQTYDRSMGEAFELLREAGLVLWNMPETTDDDWERRARKVMQKIDRFLPGGIP